MLRALLFVCIAHQFFYAQSQTNIQKSIEAFVADSAFRHTSIGIQVLDVETGEVVGAKNERKSSIPASTLKLVTTATALLQNGADFHYETAVGYIGTIQQHNLVGDLVVKGVGDPSFNSKYFPERDAVLDMVKILQQQDIRHITGDLLLDCSLFQSLVPSKWAWEDLGNYYGAALHTINYRDNLFELLFTTGKVGELAEVSFSPQLGLELKSEVRAAKSNSDNAYVYGAPFSKERIVRGTLPEYRKNFRVKAAMPSPELAFGRAVKAALKVAGIEFDGKLKIQKHLQHVQKIGVIKSPSLSEIIKITNHKSVNLFAEAMLHLVKGAEGLELQQLLRAEKDFWLRKGLNVQGLFLHDGSGLSHFNAVNPEFLCKMLQYVSKTPYSKAFEESLPIAGKSGTLKYLGKGTPLEGRVRAKSGSMKQVCCYAGYFYAKNDKKLAFVVMLNNFSLPSSKLKQKIAAMLLKW